MNELPNTVGDEAAFWANQRTLPHGAERPEDEVKRSTWRVRWLIVVPCVLVGVIAIVRGCLDVKAAERADHMRPHEITLLLPPQVDRVNSVPISGPYINRAKCEEAKAGVTVKAPGGKLVCGIVNPWRVR